MLREETQCSVKTWATPFLMCFNSFCLTLHYSHICAITNLQKRKLPQSWKDFMELYILNMGLFCCPRGIMTPRGQFKRGTSVARTVAKRSMLISALSE